MAKEDTMVGGLLVSGGLEVIKLLIQAILRMQFMTGMSDEQVNAEWTAQKEWFDEHPPEDLPYV